MSTRRGSAARAPRARNGNAPQRQRLIDACISALHLYGPSRTTVEKVVAIANMSPGIVRFYFDSKAAMLIASLKFLAAEFEEQLLEPVLELRSTPVAALERMVDLYLDPAIASPRKVSVWYAFWGEASSRQEYYDICGQKDENFAALVQELIERLIGESGQRHLDAAAVALGLIGVLEMLWQGFAFQTEGNIDRRAAKARAMAYLRSVFPGSFAERPTAGGGERTRPDLPLASWVYTGSAQRLERDLLLRAAWFVAGHQRSVERPGEYLAVETGAERVLIVRGADGRLRALRNCCPLAPHALVRAGAGRFAGPIECASHRIALDWGGTPGGEPMAGGARGDVQSDARLGRLELAVVQGLILVCGGAARTPAAHWLGTLPCDPVQVGLPREIEVAADWKILIEQWLMADATASPAVSEAWSARRYRRLLGGRKGGQRDATLWHERFLGPNHWLEQRPDGLSILQIVPAGPGRCRVRCLDFGYAEVAHRGDGARRERALRGLAARLRPRMRRAALEQAVSTQEGVSAYGYSSSSRAAGRPQVAQFHADLLARIPAFALDHPPTDS